MSKGTPTPKAPQNRPSPSGSAVPGPVMEAFVTDFQAGVGKMGNVDLLKTVWMAGNLGIVLNFPLNQWEQIKEAIDFAVEQSAAERAGVIVPSTNEVLSLSKRRNGAA